MKDEAQEQREDLQWALPASLMLHALIVALLIYGLPSPRLQTPEVQPVNVTLVPPPDAPMPAPAPQPAEEKAEEPPEPTVEKPPEQSAPEPPQSQEQPPDLAQIEVLKPVFQFADKDTGPRESLDGASADDTTPTSAQDGEPKSTVVQKNEDAVDETASGQQADEAEDGDQPAAEASEAEPTEPVETPATSSPDTDNRQDDQMAALATPQAESSLGQIDLPTSAEIPQPRPANPPKPSPAEASKSASVSGGRSSAADAPLATSQGYTGLPGVRRRDLFSQGATGDELAAASMAGVPRDERVARLCASALHRQLLDASYFPDLVPLVPLKQGNVLDVPETAFHARRIWYRLSFRCEIDTDATRVLSLSFRAGTPIPPDQWARLGLPVRR